MGRGQAYSSTLAIKPAERPSRRTVQSYVNHLCLGDLVPRGD